MSTNEELKNLIDHWRHLQGFTVWCACADELEELLARHPDPATPASETDRERARKWLRQFRYDDMQTDSLAAEFASIRAESVAVIEAWKTVADNYMLQVLEERKRLADFKAHVDANYVHKGNVAVKSADEIVEALASLAYRTPFRPHNYSDIEFDSGCIQTRDKIVSVLRSKKGTFALKGEEGK